MVADFKKTIINVLKEIKLSNIGFLLLIILFLIVALPTLTPKLFSSLLKFIFPFLLLSPLLFFLLK